MQKIPFTALPFFTRLGLMLIPFMGWIMFAEFVIDRNGWDKFLPFYRFGQICPYEGLVLAILALLWWRIERRDARQLAETHARQEREKRAPAACC